MASVQANPATLQVALVGNPNSGKTTLFNALTGLRHKVGNYAGVTVEKKEGRVVHADSSVSHLIDLPGLYSLAPGSPDEIIAHDVLLGIRDDTELPDVILNVVDASNLDRNLYLTTQLLDLGIPVVVALTMTDLLGRAGRNIDTVRLSKEIGAPVIPIHAAKRAGIEELLVALKQASGKTTPPIDWKLPIEAERAQAAVANALHEQHGISMRAANAAALTCLMAPEGDKSLENAAIAKVIATESDAMAREGIDFSHMLIAARYDRIAEWTRDAVSAGASHASRRTNHGSRIDKWVLHPFWGYVLFFLVMSIVFQAIFTLSKTPMEMITDGIKWLGVTVTLKMPAGDLKDLINDGIFGGVGAAVVFLPQILLMFFFISLLEDTGYMARAAFLMDRVMSRVGLHGKSFIPLLSAFGCAIPAVMATRTIGDRKARLITILVAPLMSCSARLPVYALMIGAFIPSRSVLKIGSITLLTLPGATMIVMYFLGMFAAFGAALVFHKTLLKGVAPTFLMEMPPYRAPAIKSVLYHMAERALQFLQRAGTVILAISIALWFLSTYPKRPDLPEEQRVEHSYSGMGGKLIEPVITPLGFDWKIGVGLIASFAARETFVSAMGTVYNVGDVEEKGTTDLQGQMRKDINPRTGKPVFNPLVAICVMVFFVLAQQCGSTIAVVRRETGGWGWALFQLFYMSGLAWVTTCLVYQIGMRMGWGV